MGGRRPSIGGGPMPSPEPVGGGPPCWQKATPDPRASTSRVVSNRGVLLFRRLIGLHNVLTPCSSAGSARLVVCRDQVGQRLHGRGNGNRDLFIHLLQQSIITDLRGTDLHCRVGCLRVGETEEMQRKQRKQEQDQGDGSGKSPLYSGDRESS